MHRRPLLLTVCLLVCLSWTAAPAAAAGNLVMRVQVPQDSAQFTYLNIRPNGVALDASGNFFVSNAWNSSIQKFNPNGQLLLQFGSYGSGAGQFNSPAGVAVDGQGNIYVADTGNHRVQKFDATGQFLLQWNSYLGATFQSNSPQDLALDSEGYVYVVDILNSRVVKFDSGGNYQNYWMVSDWSTSRLGLAVVGTGQSQYFYMTDADRNTFFKYSSFSSSKLWEVGGSGSGSGEFSSPQGVAMDGSGNFFVADQGNNRIQIFNASGAYQGQWSLGSFPAYFDSGPMGVALDGSGNVYVANTYANQLLKFDSSHALVTTWGMTGTGNGQFIFPYGAAVDSQGNFYVADTYNNRVQKFDAAGRWLANFGSGLANFYPRGLAVDAEDNLWVADPTSKDIHTMDAGGIIREFDSGGNLLRAWSTPSNYGSPDGLALDNNGHIYVTMEFFWVKPSCYIMKFDLQGQLLDIWPITNTDGSGLSGFIYGLAVDGQGNVYSGFTPYPPGNGCVVKFNSSGTLLANWDGGISGFSPYGLALDAAGNLYVSDAGPGGSGLGGSYPGEIGPGNCIRMFDPNGALVSTWNNYSPGNGQFCSPAGLALRGNNLYVADNRSLVLAINAYAITAAAGANGAISPSGTVVVNDGADQRFDITPAPGYHRAEVVVDGTPLESTPASYTFTNVTADHTIAATFALDIPVAVLTDKAMMPVMKGKAATFQVKLNRDPGTAASVSVAKESGIDGITVAGGANFNFDSANWNTYQTVTLAATNNLVNLNGTAVFLLSGPGMTPARVTARKISGNQAWINLLLSGN